MAPRHHPKSLDDHRGHCHCPHFSHRIQGWLSPGFTAQLQSRFQRPPKPTWQPRSTRRNSTRCTFHLCGVSEHPQAAGLSRMLFIKNRSSPPPSPLLARGSCPTFFSHTHEISFGDSNVFLPHLRARVFPGPEAVAAGASSGRCTVACHGHVMAGGSCHSRPQAGWTRGPPVSQQQPPEQHQKAVHLTWEKGQESAWLLHTWEGTKKAGPKGNELLGKEGQEEGRRGILGRQQFAQPSRSKRIYSEETLLSANSGPWTPGQLPGLMGRLLLLTEQGHGPVQPEAVQKVRVSPYASAAEAQVSLHYFFRFSFMSFLFFISLFFFNFLFCLGSCLASNFLFLSLEGKNSSR